MTKVTVIVEDDAGAIFSTTDIPMPPEEGEPGVPVEPPAELPLVSVEAVVETVVEGDAGSKPLGFRFTRTGDLNGVSTVDWVRSGTATDDDFENAPPMSGDVKFQPGDAEEIGEFKLKGDAKVEPSEALILTLINPVNCRLGTDTASVIITDNDTETGPPIEPPAPGKWICSKPNIGPIRRTPIEQKVLFSNEPNASELSPFTSRIPKILAGSVMQAGPHYAGADPIDHSDAGIARHAKLSFADFMRRQAGRKNARSIYDDMEGNKGSKNVPASVGYNPGKYPGAPGHCNTYYAAAYKAARDESVRFWRKFRQAVLDEAAQAKFAGLEFASYTQPQGTSLSSYDNDSRYIQQGNELNEQLICPYVSLSCTNCYIGAGPQSSWGSMNPQQLVDRSIKKNVHQMKAYRKVFPRPQRLCPTIFNVWLDGNWPNGAQILPPGALGRLCEALLDAGADGFFIFQFASHVNNTA
jgi:hypothetical protein